ncbi:MAG: aminotransferase class IV [Gammaproteobacteria bacterium]
MDRGFLFGDGVYEVIPVYGGKLFRIHQHLKRLQNSLNSIHINNPHASNSWIALFEKLLINNVCDQPDQDYAIYLQVTRGAASKRDHRFPDNLTPTVFANCSVIPRSNPELSAQGTNAITVTDTRWSRCDIKAITLLPNVLLRHEAIQAGVDEAILIRDGNAVEGSASNLFIVRNNTIITQPTGRQLLPGITRDLVIELAHKHQLPCKEINITESDLFSADEVWITSSTREIMAVTVIDGKTIGQGKPGQVCQQMKLYYQEYKALVRAGKAG